MYEVIDLHPSVAVQEEEYKRLLGLPANYVLNGRTHELAEWARQWFAENGKPWIYVREIPSVDVTGRHLRIGPADFSSPKLRDQLKGANASGAALVAVSAGRECEDHARQLWNEDKPDEYFFLEIFGSAVVEHLITRAAFGLCEWADHGGKAVLPHYSPGYPGWDIRDQEALLGAILTGAGQPLPGPLAVLDTGMLTPKKSLLAVFGISPHPETVRRVTELIPCESCSLAGCDYRRAQRKRAFPQIETIRTTAPDSRGISPVMGKQTEDNLIRPRTTS